MLDIAYMKGCVAHYHDLAACTEERNSAEALLAVTVAFEAEADLLEEQLSARATSPKKRKSRWCLRQACLGET